MGVYAFSSVPEAKSFPNGIFFDANFLVMWHLQDQEVLDFLSQASPRARLYTSTRAIDEFYMTITKSVMEKKYDSRWRTRYIDGEVQIEEAAEALQKAENFIADLAKKGVTITHISKEGVSKLATYMQQYNLLPGDASHVSILKIHELNAFATYDLDVRRIKELGFDIFTNGKSYREICIG